MVAYVPHVVEHEEDLHSLGRLLERFQGQPTVRPLGLGEALVGELDVEALLQRGNVRLLPHAHPAQTVEECAHIVLPHLLPGKGRGCGACVS